MSDVEKQTPSLQPQNPNPYPVDLSYFKILAILDGSSEVAPLNEIFKKTKMPYKVVTTYDEASLLLDGERFDILLVEFKKNTGQGPSTGFSVCQQIRAAEGSYRNIPILAYVEQNAVSQNPASTQVESAGVNDFIFKPASSMGFESKLQEWAAKIFAALPVLEEASIDKIRMFDDEEQSLLTALFQIYSDNTRAELQEIEKLVQAKDFEMLRKKAHKLKSSAAQLGAFRFEKYCNLMEYDSALDQDRAQKLYTEMSSEYVQSLEKFDRYCQKYSAV